MPIKNTPNHPVPQSPARMPTPNSVGNKPSAPQTPHKSGSGKKSGSK